MHYNKLMQFILSISWLQLEQWSATAAENPSRAIWMWSTIGCADVTSAKTSKASKLFVQSDDAVSSNYVTLCFKCSTIATTTTLSTADFPFAKFIITCSSAKSNATAVHNTTVFSNSKCNKLHMYQQDQLKCLYILCQIFQNQVNMFFTLIKKLDISHAQWK